MAIVTEAFQNTYQMNFMPLLQQKRSKLLRAVTVKTGITQVAGERHFIDQLGPRDPTQNTQRAGDSPHTAQDFYRRAMTMTSWEDGIVHDKIDTFKMLRDPESQIVQQQLRGFNRKIDDIIDEAIDATAYGGHAGTDTFDIDSGNQVAVDYDEETDSGSNSNLTPGKIRRAAEILETYEAENEGDWYFIAHPNQKHALLTYEEVTSADYAAIRALVNGEVDSWMGFHFIWYSNLDTDDDGYRDCKALKKTGVMCGFAMMPKVELIEKHPGKKFNPYSYVEMTLGATRLEEDQVVQVKCYEDILHSV
jgi:hypothetical protein